MQLLSQNKVRRSLECTDSLPSAHKLIRTVTVGSHTLDDVILGHPFPKGFLIVHWFCNGRPAHCNGRGCFLITDVDLQEKAPIEKKMLFHNTKNVNGLSTVVIVMQTHNMK